MHGEGRVGYMDTLEREREREREGGGKNEKVIDTVETLNNGHIEILSFIERLSSLWMFKCTSIKEKGPQSVFIESVYYQVFYCIRVRCEISR